MVAGRGVSADLDYARRRARAGLWIGPGFFAIASMAAVVAARIVDPDGKSIGRGLMLMVILVSGLLHLGSLFELLIVVKHLGQRPLPLAVLMLVGYWLLLATFVVVSAFVS